MMNRKHYFSNVTCAYLCHLKKKLKCFISIFNIFIAFKSYFFFIKRHFKYVLRMNLFFQVNERWLNGRAMTFGFLLVTFQLPEWRILMLSFFDQYNTWSQLFTYIPHDPLKLMLLLTCYMSVYWKTEKKFM